MLKIRAAIFLPLSLVLMALSTLNALAAEPGDKAPDFMLASNAGENISLSKYAGKIIYLDIWASWCSTCVHSLKWMNELQEKFGQDQFQIIAVNVDQNRKDAEKILTRNASNILVAFDPEGDLPRSLDISVMPTSYLIGRDGNLISMHSGLDNDAKKEIEQQIEASLRSIAPKRSSLWVPASQHR